jgi:hypothetical protein
MNDTGSSFYQNRLDIFYGGCSVMKDWYCYIDNQTYGPYPENILRELIDRRQLTVDTYVYNDSPEEAPKGWQRAGDTEIAASFLNNSQGTPTLPPIPNTATPHVSTWASEENTENRPRGFLMKASILRGTSNVPMILGITGSVLLIPMMGCILLLVGCVGSSSDVTSDGGLAVVFFLLLSNVTIILGIVGGIKSKSNPKKSSLFLAIAAVFAAILGFPKGGNILMYLIASILYLVGAIIAYKQKKVETPLED